MLPFALFYTLFFMSYEIKTHCSFFSYALKGRKHPKSTGKGGLDKKQGNQVTIMVNLKSFSVNGLVRKQNSTSIFCLLYTLDIRA